jgi:hypothetical protein
MKRLYIVFLFLVLSQHYILAQSKRYVNIELSSILSPLAEDTMIENIPFNLSFIITNMGPDTLRNDDRFYLNAGAPTTNSDHVSGGSSMILNFNKNLKVNESDTISIPDYTVVHPWMKSRLVDFCVRIVWVYGKTIQDTIIFDNEEKMRYCIPVFYINPDDFYEPEERIIDLELTTVIFPHPYDTLYQKNDYSPITFVVTNLGPDSLSQLDRVDFRLWLGGMSNSAFYTFFNKPLGINQSDTFQSKYKTNGRMIKDTIKIDYCAKLVKMIGNPNEKPIRKETTAMEKNNMTCVEVIYINDIVEDVIDSTIVEDSIVQKTNDTTYFNLYPVPAKDILYIQLGNENPLLTELALVELTGKRWNPDFQSIKEKLYIVDLSDFASGIYFLEIKFPNQTLIKKIMKE